MITEKELSKLITKSNKKKGRFSKRVVSMVILLNVLFTVGIMYIYLRTGSEPTTLIGCWFSFTTIELWELSKIKRNNGKEIDEEEDRFNG